MANRNTHAELFTVSSFIQITAFVPLPTSSSSDGQEQQSRSHHCSTSNTLSYCTLHLAVAAAGVSCVHYLMRTKGSWGLLRLTPMLCMVVMITDAVVTSSCVQWRKLRIFICIFFQPVLYQNYKFICVSSDQVRLKILVSTLLITE